MPDTIVSGQFLLWSELCALWAILTYAITPDPLPEDAHNLAFPWKVWRATLLIRLGVGFALTYLLSHSVMLSFWIGTISVAHPWMRFKSPAKWTAEVEISLILFDLFFTLEFLRHSTLFSKAPIPGSLGSAHLSAIVLVVAILLFSIRGGTYIVRSCLRKAGTLPHLHPHALSTGDTPHPRETAKPSKPHRPHPTSAAPDSASAAQSSSTQLDVAEINRGRLIGNLERLVLTIVVAAGSYAALGFLVAAKGLVRFEELQDREFAEYFLVGSLASVLVALCTGIAIRFTLVALWPELLSLHMQG
jgi:hypothetical protein